MSGSASQEHEHRRHRRLGDALGEGRTQLFTGHVRSGVADNVGAQPLLTGSIDELVYDRVRHPRNGLEHSFDVGGVDELTCDPDAMIDPAQMGQTSVVIHAPEIAGPVASLSIAAGFESLRGQRRVAPVAHGEKPALDDDFAGHASGPLVTLLVDDVHLHVRDRISDRNRVAGAGGGFVVDEELADEPAFGGAEAVDQRAVRLKVRSEMPEVSVRRPIAFEPDQPDVGKPVRRIRQLAKDRGDRVKDRHAGAADRHPRALTARRRGDRRARRRRR